MKKLISVLLLATVVLMLFVSCHDCAVCGKSKLFTEKKTILGRDYYVCKQCQDTPSNVVEDIKDGFEKAGDEISSIFKK